MLGCISTRVTRSLLSARMTFLPAVCARHTLKMQSSSTKTTFGVLTMFAGASRHSPDQALEAQYQQAGVRLHALAQPISLSKAFAPDNRAAEQVKYLASANP